VSPSRLERECGFQHVGAFEGGRGPWFVCIMYLFIKALIHMVCAGNYVPSCQSDKEPWIAASPLCALRLLARGARVATAGVVRSLRCAA
jgi:hypothetical protein